MLHKVLISSVLLFCCFTTEAYGQFDSGRPADMRKTEALLDSLHVATKAMIELTRKTAILTESAQKSTERMESLTNQITWLTWVVVVFAALQFILVERHRSGELIKRALASMARIQIRPFTGSKEQKKKPPNGVSKKGG